MSKPPASIGDEEAQALWKRATELQMAAEHGRPGSRVPTAGRAEGLSLEEILEAAEGAGIDPDYVRLALAERRLPDADQMRRDRWPARWMRFVTRSGDAIEVSRLIEAPPAAAMAAFEALVAKPAFELVPEDRVGPDPPLDGVLVYRIDPSSSFGSFHGGMTVADARVVLVTAKAEGDRTLLRLRLPLFEHGVNLAITGGLAGGLGFAGGYGGAAAGNVIAGVLGTATLALVAAPATVGALIGGALGVTGFRKLHLWGRRKGEEGLRRLLQAVAFEAEGNPGRGNPIP